MVWLAANTRQVASLAREPDLGRALLDAATSRLNGTRAAAATVRKHRMLIPGMLDYAVELRLLATNPLKHLKIPAPITEVDSRCVINHAQLKRLLSAVGSRKPSGPRLVAFFALMYYSALRPEEALNLRESNLILPRAEEADQWGELRLFKAASHVGRAWTDTGEARVERNLTQRADGHERRVPMPPTLVRLVRRHLDEFPPSVDGRLFYGYYGGELALSTYRRAWSAARKTALTAAEVVSPLAARPYDLRHACVSTWLNAGVAPTQVAAWAGHSVDVLLRIYAKCVVGQDEAARRRIEDALQ